MAIPEHVRELINQERERNKDVTKRRLSRRKGIDQESYDVRKDDGKTAEILEAWGDFHSQIPYPSLKEFYCKSALCSWLKPGKVPEELFIQLIADRYFLFLEYNEHSNNPEYPPLRQLWEAPDAHKYDPQKDVRDSDAAQRDAKNAEKVLEQGFVPTNSHYAAYKKWQENIQALKTALKLRRSYLRRYGIRKDTTPQIRVKKFSISIRQSNDAPTEKERNLAKLFRAYLKALSGQAYVKNYDAYWREENCEEAWAGRIHSVVHYLDEHAEISKDQQALILFQLFKTKTKKLAEGTLKKFTFDVVKRELERDVPQTETQVITAQKIRCNIMLYDYLLKLFPPDDIEYAKFQFYAFTGYSWYTHYILPEPVDWSSDITFELPANQSDGVDRLGYLIRQNIWFCMPSNFGWLTPDLPNTPGSDAQVLATFLMHDATLPTKSQLISRVKRFLEKDEGKSAVAKYKGIQYKQTEARAFLDNCCNTQNLRFRGEEILFDEKRPRSKKRLIYGRYVLEHALKDALCQEARENLGRIAKVLFKNLLFSDKLFDFEDMKSL